MHRPRYSSQSNREPPCRPPHVRLLRPSKMPRQTRSPFFRHRTRREAGRDSSRTPRPRRNVRSSERRCPRGAPPARSPPETRWPPDRAAAGLCRWRGRSAIRGRSTRRGARAGGPGTTDGTRDRSHKDPSRDLLHPVWRGRSASHTPSPLLDCRRRSHDRRSHSRSVPAPKFSTVHSTVRRERCGMLRNRPTFGVFLATDGSEHPEWRERRRTPSTTRSIPGRAARWGGG
mmetsp:Transcript_32866/g.75626  ORF Transcript_32866/g.75626 Transcript_32866/m.75626 type:complete len:230 (-) Transcript_32866:166-855(-)